MSRGRKRKVTFEEQEEIVEEITRHHNANILKTINVRLKAKTENQKKLMNSIKNNIITICSGSPGSGKTYVTCASALEILKNDPNIKKIVIAKSVVTLQDEEVGFLKGPQPLYEKVLTPNGWATMGDIKVGDFVFNKNGKPVKVLKTYEQKDDEPDADIYRITTKDGKYVDSCINHKWTVKTNSLDYITVTTDFLIKHINTVSFYLPDVKPIEFSDNNLITPPYLIGALLGDGSLTTGHVRLTSVDDEIINKMKDIAKEYDLELTTNNISHTLTSKNIGVSIKGAKQIRAYNSATNHEFLGFLAEQNEFFKLDKKSTKISNYIRKGVKLDGYDLTYMDVVCVGNNLIKNDLAKLNLLGCNCYNKFIPKQYLFTSVNNRIELLRGLLDTDGTIKENTGEIVFTSVSEQLIDDTTELVRSLGGSARKYKREPNKKTQILNGYNVVSRVPIYTLTIRFFNNDFNPFFLSRKAIRFRPTLSLHNKIDNIKKINPSRIKCIEIDDKDHLYVTNNYILTHNTLKEKMEPVMYSFTGNFEKMIGSQMLEALKMNGYIVEQPLAYIRGVTIDNALIIVDEVQNITKKNIKSLLTRIGENSKMICLGDLEQIDMKKPELSALKHILKMFSDTPEFGTVELTDDDIVRHPIIKVILQKFRENE